MSSIQLSEDLLIDIQKTLTKHDPKAQDLGVAVQYTSAITGLLLANFKTYDTNQKKELLQKLSEFSANVMLDNINEEQNLQNSPKDEALGIWRP